MRYSTRYQLFLVVFCFICVSLSAGIVYGWPSLRQQLRKDGSSLTESEFGVAYTVGAWSTQGCRFLTGMARNYYGTKLVAISCLAAVASGFIGLAFVDPSENVPLAIALFSVGLGSGVQLCVQPVAGLFPAYSGSILAALSGAFQISGLVFLALTSFGSRKACFLGFAGALAILILLSAIFLPREKSFVEEADEEDDESDIKAESDPTIWQQIRSLEYALLLLWFSVVITPLQYYIGSLGFQLEDKGDDNGLYADIFTIIYGCSAILAPVIGYISDRVGVGVAQGLASTLAAISFFVMATDASLNVQIISLATNAFGRMFVFGMYFAHIGKRLGYKNFGTLAGLGLLVSALVSLLQYPLIDAAARGKATSINILCGSCTVATLPYCFWLARRERREKINERDSKVACGESRDERET